MRPRRALIALPLALALLAAAPAHALELDAGEVTLPLSGFVVDLPPHAGHYALTAQYRLIDADTYAAIDTLERRSGASTLETWTVRHGKLEGDCQGHLARLAKEPTRHVELRGLDGVLQISQLSPGRKTATFCAPLGVESLVVSVHFHSSANPDPTDLELEDTLRTSPIAAAILAAAASNKVAITTALGRDDVLALPDSRPYPAPIRLPKLAIELEPPADGFAWTYDARISKTLRGEHLTAYFPTAADLGVTLSQYGRGDCESVWQREGGRVLGPARVAGFEGVYFAPDSGRVHEAHLCLSRPDRLIVAQLTSAAPLDDLEPFAPILSAIARTLSRLPAPPPLRATGVAAHGTDEALPADGFLFMQFGSELIVSSRDTAGRDEDRFPATRLTGPGLALDFVFKIDGFLGRTAFAATYGWGGLVSAEATPAARWGASHLEGAFEVGYAAGSDFILGFMAGWTGMSGPLTLNSSLSVSAVFGMVPEAPGDFGWLLRATPIQLFAANERELMSPFEVELHLTPVEGLGINIGFQWIDAPGPGDQDIPAKGWALAFGIGSAIFTAPE